MSALRLTPREAEALVWVLEEAPRVQRRHQFFVWTQGQLQVLLPHTVLVCGSYQRHRRTMVFDLFHNVVLEPAALAPLGNADSALLREAVGEWVGRGGHAVALTVDALTAEAREEVTRLLSDCASAALLVHGVARPQRLSELESLFLFTSDDHQRTPRRLQLLDILLPHMHSTWRRVQAVERDLHVVASKQPLSAPPKSELRRLVTERERQILMWMREGKSNPQIGELLSISPLTVKNHVQKILRKLNAANRAQAVAHAISMNLLMPERGSQPDAA